MTAFLTLSEMLQILENQIKHYGGGFGVRDLKLLDSAIYMPESKTSQSQSFCCIGNYCTGGVSPTFQSSFDEHYLHKTIPAMAAAYAFHICQNRPFIDGNKRAALASSLVFLDINGYEFHCKDETLYGKIMNLAKGDLKKEELIQFYEKHSKKK